MDHNLTIEQRKQLLKDELVITVEKPVYPIGGQHCGIRPTKVVGVHDSLGIKIELSHYRSNHKNKELIDTIFDLMIDELIK